MLVGPNKNVDNGLKKVKDGQKESEDDMDFFGFDKGNEDSSYVPGHIAGDVANAVVAYGATKAMLPLRVGLSLYLAPMFSRRCIEPLRRGIMGIFR